MNEITQLLDGIPVWVPGFAGGTAFGIIMCFAVLGYRTFMGTTVEIQTVAVEVPVPVPVEVPADPVVYRTSSLDEVLDGLYEPAPPSYPEGPWLRDPTGSLPVLDLAPEPEPHRDEEPRPDPYARFAEPKPPVALEVGVEVHGVVRSERIVVAAS